MSGGIAYIYDPTNEFKQQCNMGMVGLEYLNTPSEIKEVQGYIKEHVLHTKSLLGEEILKNWSHNSSYFIKVMPHDYKRVLEEEAKEKRLAKESAANNSGGLLGGTVTIPMIG